MVGYEQGGGQAEYAGPGNQRDGSLKRLDSREKDPRKEIKAKPVPIQPIAALAIADRHPLQRAEHAGGKQRGGLQEKDSDGGRVAVAKCPHSAGPGEGGRGKGQAEPEGHRPALPQLMEARASQDAG
ncbi:hypothetical protein D3C81_1004700 [compost metagenome]